MKELFINNKIVILSDNVSFPFSISTLDIENPSLILVGKTKEFTIPRCAQNDEIFGNLGNLNHIANSYSYNQVQKSEYILYNDSVKVSEGLIVVNSVDDTNYNVHLIDRMADLIERLGADKMYEILALPHANKLEYSSDYLNDIELSSSLDYQLDFENGNFSGYSLGYVNSDISNNFLQFKYYTEIDCNCVIRIVYSGSTYILNSTIELKPTNGEWKIKEIQIPTNTLTKKKSQIKLYVDDTCSFKDFMISDIANNLYTGPAPKDLTEAVENYSVLPENYSDFASFKYDAGILIKYIKANGLIKPTFNWRNTNDYDTTSLIGRSGTTLTLPSDANGMNLETMSITEMEGTMYIKDCIKLINNHYGDIIRLDTDIFDDMFMYLSTLEPNDMKKQRVLSGSTNNLTNYAKYTSNGNYADWSFDIIKKDNSGTYYLDIDFDFKLGKSSINTKLIPTKNNAPVCFIYNGITYYLASDYSGADTSTYKKLVNGTKVGECYFGICDGLLSGDTKALIKYSLIYGENVFASTSGTVGSSDRKIDYNFIFNNVGIQTDIVSDNNNKHFFMFEYKPNELYLNDALSPTLIASVGYLTSNYTINISQDKVHCFDYFNLNKLLPSCTVKEFLLMLVKYFNLTITNDDGVLVIDKRKFEYSEEQPLIEVRNIDINTIKYNKLVIYATEPSATELENYKSSTGKEWCEKIINTGYQIKKNKQEINFNCNIPIYIRPYNNWTYLNLGNNVSGTYCKYGVGGTEGMINKIGFGFLKKNTPNNTFIVFNTTIDKVNNDYFYIRNNPQLYIPSGSTKYTYDTSILPTSYGTWTTLPSFNTLVPYQFNNGVISKSLELNKPQYNYGMITDSMYSDDVTLYSKVFKPIYNDIYNADTFKVNASMYIDGVLDMSKIYNIDGSLFLIITVDEYDPTIPDKYDVELIRVNNLENYINNNLF